jgi:hypothetical protein
MLVFRVGIVKQQDPANARVVLACTPKSGTKMS